MGRVERRDGSGPLIWLVAALQEREARAGRAVIPAEAYPRCRCTTNTARTCHPAPGCGIEIRIFTMAGGCLTHPGGMRAAGEGGVTAVVAPKGGLRAGAGREPGWGALRRLSDGLITRYAATMEAVRQAGRRALTGHGRWSTSPRRTGSTARGTGTDHPYRRLCRGGRGQGVSSAGTGQRPRPGFPAADASTSSAASRPASSRRHPASRRHSQPVPLTGRRRVLPARADAEALTPRPGLSGTPRRGAIPCGFIAREHLHFGAPSYPSPVLALTGREAGRCGFPGPHVPAATSAPYVPVVHGHGDQDQDQDHASGCVPATSQSPGRRGRSPSSASKAGRPWRSRFPPNATT